MRALLALLLALQLVLIAGVAYVVFGPRSQELDRAVDNLEQTRTRLAGNLSRVQQQEQQLMRLQAQLLEQLREKTPGDTAERPPGPDSPQEAARDELSLLREIERLQAQRAEQADQGQETQSLNDLISRRLDEFADCGAPSLALLAEELRARRDPGTRRFILEELLPRFEHLDPTACFRAARMVLMDAVADAALRTLSARQALQFEPERALDDVLDVLRLGTAKDSEELRVGLLQTLEEHPMERAAETIRGIARNPQWGVKVQTQAIRTLSRYPGSATTEALREIVETGLIYAQVGALDSLAILTGQDLLPYLAKLLEKGEDELASAVRSKAHALQEMLEKKG
ncbi:MAG: hypothetical protein AB1486_00180 [Planctomycetota bacterium]